MAIANPAERQPIFNELRKPFEALPMLPIWNGPNIVVVHCEVSSARAWPMAMTRYWGIQLTKKFMRAWFADDRLS